MRTAVAAIGGFLLVGACGQSVHQQPAANSSRIASAPAPVPASGTGPDARTPLARPADAVDAKSSEAAVALARDFARVLDQRKFGEAWMLLGPGAPPRGEFERQFARYAKLHVSVGEPGAQEGAAGSIYVSVPLDMSGRAATLILRRVNDVPGSTEAQRRWHIERIEWGNAP